MEAGTALAVIYDTRNPSINVAATSDIGADCYESGIGSFLAAFFCAILGIVARLILAFRKPPPAAIAPPRAAAVVAEIQNVSALSTSACLFWVVGSLDIYEFPGNLIVAGMLSLLPVLWGVFAAQGLYRGKRIGWQLSFAGDIISFGILYWCGMRSPFAMAAAGVLLGIPVVLLLLPDMTGAFLKASGGELSGNGVRSEKRGRA